MTTIKNITNCFATSNQDPEAVTRLITVGMELMTPAGVLSWSKVEDALPADSIGYARGWLIVRRAYLEANQPELLVDVAGMTEAARAKAEASHKLGEFDPVRQVHAPVIANLKDDKQLSWGEIMCRTGLTEGQCRKAYRATDAKKDLGIRNGHGGRFAYDDPTLYLDNRKAQGAYIPTSLTGKPRPEDLLNFQAKAEAAKAAVKAAAKPKAPAPKAPAPAAEGPTQAAKKAARKAARATA